MLRRTVLISLAALWVPVAAFAVGASNQGIATVLTPLSVNGVRDLDFQNVFPGVAKAVARTDATSGKWTIVGQAGAEVTIDFTLPSSLASAGNNLPISFSSSDAGRNIADNMLAATAFDPSLQETTTLEATTGELFVWLGGQVSPAGNQPAGIYQAAITADVNYTGN
jgi:hypothetical protein